MQKYSIWFKYTFKEMLIIGIAGGTGSGKTTVVRKIIESLPAGEVVLYHRIHTTKTVAMSRLKNARISILTIPMLLNGVCFPNIS